MMGRMYVMNDLRSDSKLVQKVVNFVRSDEFKRGSTLVGNGSVIALGHDIWDDSLIGHSNGRVSGLKMRNKENLIKTLKPIVEAVKEKGGMLYLIGGETELPVEDFDYEWLDAKGFSREQERFMSSKVARSVLKKESVHWKPYLSTRGRVLLLGADALDDGIEESFLKLFGGIEVVICPYLPVFDPEQFPFKAEMTKTDKRRMEALANVLRVLPQKSIICIGGHFGPELLDSIPNQIFYDVAIGEKRINCIWNKPGVVLDHIEFEQ